MKCYPVFIQNCNEDAGCSSGPLEGVVMESPLLGSQGDGQAGCPVKTHPNCDNVLVIGMKTRRRSDGNMNF